MAGKKRSTKRKRATRKTEQHDQPNGLLLPMNEANLERLCRTLRNIHSHITESHTVMRVVADGLSSSVTELDQEYAEVLTRHAIDPIFGELVELRYTIRQLGGVDLFSSEYDDRDPAEQDEEERNGEGNRSFE